MPTQAFAHRTRASADHSPPTATREPESAPIATELQEPLSRRCARGTLTTVAQLAGAVALGVASAAAWGHMYPNVPWEIRLPDDFRSYFPKDHGIPQHDHVGASYTSSGDHWMASTQSDIFFRDLHLSTRPEGPAFRLEMARESHDLQGSTLREAEELLGEMASWYAPELKVPTEMGLLIKDHWRNAGYHSGLDAIIVPQNYSRFCMTEGPHCRKPFSATPGILAHEFGHKLFQDNVAARGRGTIALFLRRFFGGALSYEELFADAAAVAFLDDPQAIANALAWPDRGDKPTPSKKHVASRDFTAKLDPDDWADRESHGELGPVRTIIGHDFPELIQSPGGVSVLLDCIIEAMDQAYEASNLLRHEVSVADRNQFLIDAIERWATRTGRGATSDTCPNRQA